MSSETKAHSGTGQSVVNGHSRYIFKSVTRKRWLEDWHLNTKPMSSRKARRLTRGHAAAVRLGGIAQIVTTAIGPRLSAPHRVDGREGYMCVQTA